MRISTSQFQIQSIKGVLDQQARLAKIQQQVSSGKRVLTPADDPVAAARALEISGQLKNLAQIKDNAGMAEQRLRAEESALTQVGDMLLRVKELTIQANNASQDADNRRFIATELRERLAQLVEIANGKDGSGEYLFGGSESRNQPFTRTAAGVAYNGDQNERMVQIGPSRQMAITHTGLDVFMKIPNGNGSFLAAPGAANAGTGVVSPGEVIEEGLTAAESFQVGFADDGLGGLNYTVTDASGAAVGSGPYVAGEPMSFGVGLSVTVPETPAPVDGDSLDIATGYPYRIEFSTNADSGELEYTVYAGTSDPAVAVVPATPYVDGAEITFAGLSVEIGGTPAAGDRFELTPSSNQSVFDSMENLIAALEGFGDTPQQRAALNNAVNRSLTELDAANENMLSTRASVGARMNALDTEVDSMDLASLDLESARSDLVDLDYAKAISEFNLKMVGLQAAQQSYVQIQGLSLFNFLR